MSNSVYQRKDGRWTGSIQVDGKRKSVYGKTKKEAKDKLAELQKQIAQTNSVTTAGTKTVNDLLDLFLQTAELRPISVDNYERLFNLHIRPTLGHIRLTKIQPAMLQSLYSDLRQKGFESQAHFAHLRLHRAFKLAVLWGWLPSNPCERVLPPKYQPKRKELWTSEELATFLEATSEHYLYPLFVTAITCGLRLSELNGLKWEDVNLDEGTLAVKRGLSSVKGKWVESKPKTKAGNRTITLPESTMSALRQQQAQQDGWRTKSGGNWNEGDWIFTNRKGLPIPRKTVQDRIKIFCEDLGITHVTPHGLRHLHASLLIGANIPVPAVSRRLGHSNPAITLRVYSHALSGQDQAAADAIDMIMMDGGQ